MRIQRTTGPRLRRGVARIGRRTSFGDRRSTLRGRLLILIPALLLPLLVLPSGSAAADSNCSLHTCNAEDPVAAGCDADPGKTTLDVVTDGSGSEAQLRYSPLCNAMWARNAIDGDPPASVDWETVLESKSAVPGSPTIDSYYFGADGWTPMMDSARLNRACMKVITGGGGPYVCTAWWLPRISYGNVLEIPQGAPSALDTTCPYGERYWASGVSGSGSWGVTWHVSGLVPWGWYHIAADVRCDGTATNALYDVDDPSGGRHWFQVDQLVYDWAPLGSGTWQADGGGNLTVRLSDGKNPNGQVVAASLSITQQSGGIHCPCPSDAQR